ncbi:MAG: translation initiation factor IF-2 [Vampirovibrionales bacterium]|nr:translation initiation factor IF-2 [Vampirovibrionales bacterium]
MSKVRIYELAKVLDVGNKELLDLMEAELGVTVKSHSSTIESHIAKKLTELVKAGKIPTSTNKPSPRSVSSSAKSPATPAPPPVPAAPILRVIKKKDRSPVVEEEETPKTGLSALRAQTEAVAREHSLRRPDGRPDPHAYAAIAHEPEPVTEVMEEPEVDVAPEIEPTPEVIVADVEEPIVVEATPEIVVEEAPVASSEVGESPEATPTPTATVEIVKPTAPQSLGRVQSSLPNAPNIRVVQANTDKKSMEPTILGKAAPRVLQAGQRTPGHFGPGYRSPGATGPGQQGGQAGRGGPRPPGGGATRPPGAAPAGTAGQAPTIGADGLPRTSTGRFNTVPPNLRGGVGNKKEKVTEVDKQVVHRRKGRQREVELEPVTEVMITGQLTVRELAEKLGKTDTDIIRHMFMKGMMVTVNQTVEMAFAKAIAEEMEIKVLENESKTDTYDATTSMAEQKLDEATYKHLAPKSPVISIMGHVDHGKTSLLDALKESRTQVTAGEAGGITQRIGAYTVEKNGQRIVFLDTPGHEAFTAMRMRGAAATNIAILVVAADDGVMPQTIEAINHAKAANIPIIIAVNKCDKDNADPDRVLGQLAEHGLTAEDWGGDVLVARVSATKKTGLDDLLEHILLVSELLNLQGDPTVAAEGVIIEARLDKRRGPLVSALVQNGTLHVGDNILIGSVSGRVRALIDDKGKTIKEAGPSTPVEILGLSEVPNAGERLEVILDNAEFKRRVADAKGNERQSYIERRQILPGLQAPDGSGLEREQYLNFIVKGDMQGTTEAVNESMTALSNDEVKIKIIHSGTGNITEADVMLATASKAIIVGFNVQADNSVQNSAERNGVSIRTYDVIYHLTDDVEKMMVGELAAEIIENESGRAEVRQLFPVGKLMIAGCMVTDGKVVHKGTIQVLRKGKEIYRGGVASLKRFKDDVKEVAQGFECGIRVEGFNELEIGDELVFMVREERVRTLDSMKKAAEKAVASRAAAEKAAAAEKIAAEKEAQKAVAEAAKADSDNKSPVKA